MPVVVTQEGSNTWKALLNNDELEIGDIMSPVFKPHIKHKRGTGLCEFSLSYDSVGGIATYDSVNQKLGFVVDDDISVEMFGKEPTDEFPEGAPEFNIILKKKPKAGKNTITLKLESDTIVWQKILPLDVEFDQAKCAEQWETYPAPYTITPTEIRDANGEILKKRDDSLINSYYGKAKQAYVKKTSYGLNNNKQSPYYGNEMSYNRVSRTHCHIKRRKMKDAVGKEAWVEDMNLDQDGNLTFTLPADFLKSATYPIQNACGTDPAYTEELASGGQPGTDGTWVTLYDSTFGVSTSNAVLEYMLENQQKGAENLIGVRAYGGSLSRYVNIHECEPTGGGAGDTHCRMFVQGDNSGNCEFYTEDASDTEIYLLGYWENVGFTELMDGEGNTATSGWEDEVLETSACANRVCHIIAGHSWEAAETYGVREKGSSLERSVLMHEAEGGGYNYIDFLVKADSNYTIQNKQQTTGHGIFYNLGYFGAELDFVEK